MRQGRRGIRGGGWGQTPNMGLRHPLEEGAGKRCLECGVWGNPLRAVI